MDNFNFKTEPYEHQRKAMDIIKDSKYYALFMEQGTGKTKVSIDVANYHFQRKRIDAVLLIAPNGVHEQWAKEQIPIHSSNEDYDLQIWDSKKMKSRARRSYLERFFEWSGNLKWFFVNVEYFSTFTEKELFTKFVKDNKTMIIVDESTRIKNANAKRTKNIMGLGKHSVINLILTGTPVTRSPFDLWAMFEFMKNNFWECNYHIFNHRYGIHSKDINQYTGRSFQRLITEEDYRKVKWYIEKGNTVEDASIYSSISEKNVQFIMNMDKFSPYKRMNELRDYIKNRSFFVTKEECLDLPPKIFETVYVDPSPEQMEVYKNLKKHMYAEIGNRELSILNKVSLLMRLMQVTGGFFPSKYKAEMLEGLDDDEVKSIIESEKPILIGKKNPKIERLKLELEEVGEEKIIIWANFTAEVEMIMKELKKTFPHWRIEGYYGKIKKNERNKIKEDFQNGKVKILVANPSVGATGLNLQVSNLHYFFSNGYNLEFRLQSEDRSHRIGQKKTVLYKDLVIRKTTDEMVSKSLRNKKDILDFFRQNSLSDFLGEE